MVDFDLDEERAASEDAAEQAMKDAEEDGYKAGLEEGVRCGLLEAAGMAEEYIKQKAKENRDEVYIGQDVESFLNDLSGGLATRLRSKAEGKE